METVCLDTAAKHYLAIDISPVRQSYGFRVLEAGFSHSQEGTSDFTLHPDGADLVVEFKRWGHHLC